MLNIINLMTLGTEGDRHLERLYVAASNDSERFHVYGTTCVIQISERRIDTMELCHGGDSRLNNSSNFTIPFLPKVFYSRDCHYGHEGLMVKYHI